MEFTIQRCCHSKRKLHFLVSVVERIHQATSQTAELFISLSSLIFKERYREKEHTSLRTKSKMNAKQTFKFSASEANVDVFYAHVGFCVRKFRFSFCLMSVLALTEKLSIDWKDDFPIFRIKIKKFVDLFSVRVFNEIVFTFYTIPNKIDYYKIR